MSLSSGGLCLGRGGEMQRTGNESTEAWGAVRSLSSRTQEAGGDRPDEPRGPRQAVL